MTNFSPILLDWYSKNKRELPWRNTLNPYKIWLSEIILQQTRVDQGMGYYLKFTEKYETIKDLSEASEDEVLSLWQGLGYYSRGRNLRKAAIQVMEEFGGVFPKDSINLKKLKGVGDYSSAAISSFSNDEKIAVVDGNVFRVLSRIFNISTPIDTGKGKKEFTELLEHLISTDKPDIFNQSIMEFGAIQCTPKSPNCSVCHWQEKCVANNTNKVHFLPIKSKKIKQRIRYFNYIVYKKDKNYFIQKRTKKDIWENMYEFPLLETKAEITDLPLKQIENGYINSIKKFTHLLSHQKIFVTFWEIHLEKYNNSNRYVVVNKNTINDYPFPKIVENYITNEL